MTPTNPTPTQQPETLEGCPFCPAELTPLPSAHLPVDLHEQASEWYQITHNAGCYFVLLGFGDYPIHRDRLKAWNTRRVPTAGPSDVERIVQIINQFSICRDHDQPSHCVQCDLRHKTIAAIRDAVSSSPTPAHAQAVADRINAGVEKMDRSQRVDAATMRIEFTSAPPESTRVAGEQDLEKLYPKYKCPQCGDWFHMPYKFCKCKSAAATADNEAESLLLSKITTIADIGSAGEFEDALSRLQIIRRLIDDATTKGDR